MKFNLPLSKKHFDRALVRESVKVLLKESVDYVSIETFSYCNRKCWFCANSFIERADKKANQVMEMALLEKTLSGLGEIDYDRTINLSGYNEPMADERIIKHIATVRRIVPNAIISIYSNGDYLTREMLADMYEAGLNEMYLSIHTGNDENLNDAKVQKRLDHFSNKLGLNLRMSHMEPGKQYKGRIHYENMYIQLYEPNMKTMGSDMGGLIEGIAKSYSRTEACFEPTSHMTFEYNGNLVPCCRIRTDAKEHKDLSICSMVDVDDIFQAYMHPNLIAWRNAVSFQGQKQSPCDTCDNALYTGNFITRWRLQRLKNSLSK